MSVEATYKARDVEEAIDVWFYRPVGYLIARGCRALGITPNTVTIVSIFIGVAGGHLLYYRDVWTNVLGILLWIIADTLDSVDGQLARMTDHRSRIGRILDGLGGNIMFVSFYSHLFARLVVSYPEVGWVWWVLLVLAGGISHSIQSSLADYYRNAYLKIVIDPVKSELDNSAEVRAEYQSITFGANPVRKFLLRIYLNYTIQQESFSRNFQELRKAVGEVYGWRVPGWLADEYRRLNLPLMKYYAVLTTNTRMIVMSAAVLADIPWAYFAVEVVAINLLMIVVTAHQEKLSKGLVARIRSETGGS
jgi:phosphatidylglycerophosphate synthase